MEVSVSPPTSSPYQADLPDLGKIRARTSVFDCVEVSDELGEIRQTAGAVERLQSAAADVQIDQSAEVTAEVSK